MAAILSSGYELRELEEYGWDTQIFSMKQVIKSYNTMYDR